MPAFAPPFTLKATSHLWSLLDYAELPVGNIEQTVTTDASNTDNCFFMALI